MVDRFTSQALEIPAPDETELSRVDLVFYDVDHSGSSYEARVYIDAPDADITTPRDADAYAGSYHVLGHGGCFGEQGHCDIAATPDDPFDYRGPHQMTPQTKIVTVTDAIRSRLSDEPTTITVTVVAQTPGDRPNDVLSFSKLRLLSYE